MEQIEAYGPQRDQPTPSYNPKPVKKKFISNEEVHNKDEKHPPTSAGMAALEHFGNAATMGHLPHLQAMTDFSDDDSSYVEKRDENLRRIEQERHEHPIASTVGSVGGTVATAIPLGHALSKYGGAALKEAYKALPGGPLPPLLEEAATLPANVVKGGFKTISENLPSVAGTELATSAATGGAAREVVKRAISQRIADAGKRSAMAAPAAAITGMMANPGDKKGEFSPLQPLQRAQGGAAAAAIGVPLQWAGEGLVAGAKAAAPYVKSAANNIAFRALGPFTREINKYGDRKQEIGRAALDHGVVGGIPTSARGLAKRAAVAKKIAGRKLGDIADELGELENKFIKSGISRDRLLDEVERRLVIRSEIPAIQRRNEKYRTLIDEMRDGRPFNFKSARKAKMDVGGSDDKKGVINWKRLKEADVPLEEEFHRELYTVLKETENHGAKSLERAAYGESSDRFENAKEAFGDLSAAQKIASRKSKHQEANQILGLGSKIAGAGAASVGSNIGSHAGPEMAALGGAIGYGVGAITNHLAKHYGAQVSATTINNVAKMLHSSPELLNYSIKHPNFIPHLLHSLGSKKDMDDI